ncbi:MAG: hypothetical protein ACE5IK_13435 [Acidobacteriota bacterium]
MAWIEQIDVAAATGVLKRQFDAALKRAGRVWNIIRVMSVHPAALASSMHFYGVLMKGRSPLTRAQREMLATVVAIELACHY